MVDSFRNETPSCCSEMQNSAVAVFGIFFVGEKEQKQPFWCLKRKYIDINLLFIELFYKIIYIYAFSRCFYPKQLTIAFRLYIFISTCVPWESNPQPFA